MRRISRLEIALALVGGLAALTMLLSLLETWRIGSPPVSHHIIVLGWRLGYPSANLAAVIVLVLAGVGGAMLLRGSAAALRELRGARRLARRLSGAACGEIAGAVVIARDAPGAFCAGLWRPTIFVTTRTLAILDPAALDAVLAHERHHARCRDPLRLAITRVLTRSLFFLPAAKEVGRMGEELSEILADQSAVRAAGGSPGALARAMLRFSDATHVDSAGVDPRRIDHLLGDAPPWRFPVMLGLSGLSLLALLIALALLAGREASGAASLAPPFLSAQPCVMMLALLPALVGVGSWRARRLLATRRR